MRALLDDWLPRRVGMARMAMAFRTGRTGRREGAHDRMPGVDDAGRARPDRCAGLAASLRDAGPTVRHDLVPGAGHDHLALIPTAVAFLAAILSRTGQETSA